MLRHRPALRFVVLLSGGILAAQTFSLPVSFLFLSLVAGFASALIFRFRPSSDLILQACIVLLGLTMAVMERDRSRFRKFSSSMVGDTVCAYGVLEENPTARGKTICMVLASDSVLIRRSNIHQPRRFIVYASVRKFNGLTNLWRVGQSVEVRGLVEEFPAPRNPGEFDYGRYLGLNEIDGILWLNDTASVDVRHRVGVRIWFNALRARFAGIFERLHDSRQASFLRGVLLGDRSDIPADVKQSFVNTGTIHILAVSGAHGAVIAAALYVVLGMFRFSRRWVILLTVTGLIFYMLLTGASASIVRATIMTSVVLFAKLLERKTDMYNSIATAALIILLWSPSQLLNVGFQLSFAAVISIVSIYPRLNILIQKIPARFEEIKAVDSVLKLFAVSLAAQLGTLPFTAYYFERFSIVSLAANMIVVPLVGINLILGCVTLIASAISGWIAASYAMLNEMLVRFLLGFVSASASVPFAYVQTAGFSLSAAVLYYIGLSGMLNINKPRTIKWAVGALMLFLNLSLYWRLYQSLVSPPLLSVTALDVGQGDALLIRFPLGSTMLIDAGPRTFASDAGERSVVPFLERTGITELNAMLVSHPHSDHIGGMPYLLTRIRVGTVYEADTVVTSKLHALLREEIRDNGIRWRQLRPGEQISPDPSVRVYCLAPSFVASGSNLNNRSIVLKIAYGETSAILTGDAESEEEESILRRYRPFLKVGLLKAGHHGSSTSSTEEFLNGMSANFAILSVGKNNKFRHPSPAVVERMEAMGMSVLRTDREGAIVFESDGAAWNRIRWRTEGP